MEIRLALIVTGYALIASAQSTNCDLKDYKAQEGLTAANRGGALELQWSGERGETLRASFTIHDGQPLVHELAARKSGAAWTVLGRDLKPEFQVTSGNGAYPDSRFHR